MGEMTLWGVLEEYKNVYMAYRNFAERTREEYKNDLENFIVFLEKSGITIARQLKLPVIERYVAELERRGYASLTRKRKVVTIRSFLMFLYQDEYTDVNIAKMVVLPYTESTTPNFLTVTECNRLNEACANNPRDRAIVVLLLQTGIKLSELIRLTVDDVDFEEAGEKESGFVRVRGGWGKKDRSIPINPHVCFVLKNYLLHRMGSNKETLFLNRLGEPLGERGVQKIIKKYFKKAGIETASVHTLRHTFGVQNLKMGMSPKTIKEIMGFKDTRSMSTYFSLTRNE